MRVYWSTKSFAELSKKELYELLQLRQKIFIVEQKCAYLDADGKDFDALHLLGLKESELIAYTRILAPGSVCKEASIGRVLIAEDSRGQGLAHDLVKEAISVSESIFKSPCIRISAQQYLENFYKGHGFLSVGQTYLEDGLAHIEMLRS